MSFKAWHAATGKVHPVVATADKVTFSANAVYGSVTKPYVLNATNAVEQQFSLHQGWQWLSFSVTPVDATVASTFALWPQQPACSKPDAVCSARCRQSGLDGWS